MRKSDVEVSCRRITSSTWHPRLTALRTIGQIVLRAMVLARCRVRCYIDDGGRLCEWGSGPVGNAEWMVRWMKSYRETPCRAVFEHAQPSPKPHADRSIVACGLPRRRVSSWSHVEIASTSPRTIHLANSRLVVPPVRVSEQQGSSLRQCDVLNRP
jgi:hypothetical protein